MFPEFYWKGNLELLPKENLIQLSRFSDQLLTIFILINTGARCHSLSSIGLPSSVCSSEVGELADGVVLVLVEIYMRARVHRQITSHSRDPITSLVSFLTCKVCWGIPKTPLAPILHVLEEEATRMPFHIGFPPTNQEDGPMLSLSRALP